MKARIAHYSILHALGEGGMGTVYAARDERLGRVVALKTIKKAGSDHVSRERFQREARAAASVSHPNVCQLFELGEDEQELFITMELLEGESLAARLARGALPVAEALQVTLDVLAALDALQARGVIHRDIKPSNIFLTPHGVKLLDFGLAQPTADVTMATPHVTQTGTLVGTPRYMAPEQWQGRPVDRRTDLFSLGAVLFEMLSGRPAFPGATAMEVSHATLNEEPPALVGSPAICFAGRVAARALAKRPDDRFQSAADMAKELRATLRMVGNDEPVAARAVTRLVVVPFRMLRADAETEFLAVSLPDAIAAALSGIDSLVVRSSAAAGRYGGGHVDVATIARDMDVDSILTGTLLRAGDRIRLTTQLVEAPAGTLIWSHTTQVQLGDLFQLQDDLARGIVESLALPLSRRERSLLTRDVPATAKAYEFYLRANQLSLSPSGWLVARDLYLECIQEDPRYAPAWARLGRTYRLLAKFGGESPDSNFRLAQEAFARALELNPDLPLAHNLYASLEVELGRPIDALTRLLQQAAVRRADPELLAGLVLACRYCGLFDASLAAHAEAQRLDANVRTSVSYTYWMLGEFERAIAHERQDFPFMRGYGLSSLGRVDEALALYRESATRDLPPVARAMFASQRAALEGDRVECLAYIRQVLSSGFRDPEGLYFAARTLAHIGELTDAMGLLDRVVVGGFYPHGTLLTDPWLDALRADAAFQTLVDRVAALQRDAAAAFEAAKGSLILSDTRAG